MGTIVGRNFSSSGTPMKICVSYPVDVHYLIANLRCRQAQIPNRPVGQNTTGTYQIGLFSGDNHLVFFNTKKFCNPFGNLGQRPSVPICLWVKSGFAFI